MADRMNSRPRLLNARRVSTLTGVVALTAAGVIGSAEAHAEGEASDKQNVIATQAEGEGEAGHEGEGEGGHEGEGEAGHEGEGEASLEGEGEAGHGGEGEGEGGAPEDEEVALLTDLGFMEGHIRAGLALYEQGDVAAAKTHMGHPIEEKYGAVEEQLERSGHGVLQEQIIALAEATEAEAELAEIEGRFAEVRETMEAVREEFSVGKQVAGLVALSRIAGDEYAAAIADGDTVSDLHEYQDSWGFLRVVEAEATQMADSEDAAVAEVARALLEQIAATDAVYGDLQGEGSFEADAAIIYGAAARMELAGLKLDGDSSAGEGEGGHEGEGEGEGGHEGEGEAGHEGEGEAGHEGEGEAGHEGEGEAGHEGEGEAGHEGEGETR